VSAQKAYIFVQKAHIFANLLIGHVYLQHTSKHIIDTHKN